MPAGGRAACLVQAARRPRACVQRAKGVNAEWSFMQVPKRSPGQYLSARLAVIPIVYDSQNTAIP